MAFFSAFGSMLQFPGGRVVADRVIAGHPRITLFQSSDRLADVELAFESALVNPLLKTNQVSEKPPFLFLTNRPVFARLRSSLVQSTISSSPRRTGLTRTKDFF